MMFTDDSIEEFMVSPSETMPLKRHRTEAFGISEEDLANLAFGDIHTRVKRATDVIPRQMFVPSRYSHLSNDPFTIPLGFGRHMPSVHDTTRLLIHADIHPSERILEVGTGNGYMTAVLATLHHPNHIVSLDWEDCFLEEAQDCLQSRMGLSNVVFFHEEDPAWTQSSEVFDTVLVSCPLDTVRNTFIERLSPSGRLLGLIRTADGELQVVRVTRGADYLVHELL